MRLVRRFVGATLAALTLVIAMPAWAEDVPSLAKKLLGDTDLRVRTQAALALGASGSDKAVEPLCKGLDDSEKTVRAAAAAALGKLQKGGKACLEKRLAKEKADNVRKMIAKAVGILDEAASGPVLGKSTKYYVAFGIVRDATGRNGSEVATLLRSAMLKRASSIGGFAFAPGGETKEQAQKRLRKHEHVYGYLFDSTVKKQQGGGKLAITLDMSFSSYPEKEPLGSLTRTEGLPSGDEQDKAKEDALIEKVGRVAIDEFARMAAQID